MRKRRRRRRPNRGSSNSSSSPRKSACVVLLFLLILLIGALGVTCNAQETANASQAEARHKQQQQHLQGAPNRRNSRRPHSSRAVTAPESARDLCSAHSAFGCRCLDEDSQQLACSVHSDLQLRALVANLTDASANNKTIDTMEKRLRFPLSYLALSARLLLQSPQTGDDSSEQRLATTGSLQVERLALELRITTGSNQEAPTEEPQSAVSELSRFVDALEAETLHSLSVTFEGPLQAHVVLVPILQRLAQLSSFELKSDGRHIVELPADAFSKQQGIRSLRIVSVILQVKPSGNDRHANIAIRKTQNHKLLIPQASIESVTFEQCRLKALPLVGAKYGALQALNLAHNELTSIATSLFADEHLELPALAILDLSYNQVHALGASDAKKLLRLAPALGQLHLRRNKLISLDLGALLAPASLPVAFKLANSSLASIEINQSKLELIDASYNRIGELSLGANAGSSNLRFVDLSANSLNEATEEAIEPSLLGSLVFSEHLASDEQPPLDKRLDLQYLRSLIDLSAKNDTSSKRVATPQSLCERAAGGGFGLAELVLSRNKMVVIRTQTFATSHCGSIEILRLDRNQLAGFESGEVFEGLRNLQLLDMSRNQLRRLPARLFSATPSLRHLDLAQNKLEALANNQFDSLKRLEHLSLAGNKLSELRANAFKMNRALATLDLSANKLSELSDTQFVYQRRLAVLDLSHNQVLRRVPSFALADSKIDASAATLEAQESSEQSLSTLSFANNLIEQLPLPRLSACARLSRLQVLELSFNRLTDLSNQTSSAAFLRCAAACQELRLKANRIWAIDETTFARMLQLKLLDLSHNKLASIKPGVFAFAWSLEAPLRLSLTGNELNANTSLTALFGETQPAASEVFAAAASSQILNLESLDLSDNKQLNVDASQLAHIAALSRGALRSVALQNVLAFHVSVGNATVDGSSSSNGAAALELGLHDLVLTTNAGDVQLVAALGALARLGVRVNSLDLSNNRLSALINDTFELGLLSTLFATNRHQDYQDSSAAANSVIQMQSRRLDLSNNSLKSEQLTSLMKGLAVNNAQITSLSLAANLLDKWPTFECTASFSRALHSLDLSRNKLRRLPTQSVDSESICALESLRFLNLSANSLVALAPSAFDSFSFATIWAKLQVLDLSFNRLVTLPKQILALSELRELRLDYNKLDSLANALPLPSKLQILDASHNNQLKLAAASSHSSIVGPVYRNAFSLDDCNRDRAYYTDLDSDDTSSASHAEDKQPSAVCSSRLVLSFNSIALGPNISRQSIASLFASTSYKPRSMSLELRDNFLQLIEPLSFQQASSLAKLDLAQNKLSEASFLPDSLAGLSNMESLDLSHNLLASVFIRFEFIANKQQHAQASLASLVSLKLSHNRVRVFKLSYQQQPTTRNCTVVANCNAIYEASLRGLKELALDHNLISDLSLIDAASLLERLPALESVDFSHNLLKSSHGSSDLRSLASIAVKYKLSIRAEPSELDASDLAASAMASGDEHELNGRLRFTFGDDAKQVLKINSGKRKMVAISIKLVEQNKQHSEDDTNNEFATTSQAQRVSFKAPTYEHQTKYCALQFRGQSELCIDLAPSSSSSLLAPRVSSNLDNLQLSSYCFYLFVPQQIKSCVTRLASASLTEAPNSTTATAKTLQASQAVETNASNSLETVSQATNDVVIDVIDSLKSLWLRWRQLDLSHVPQYLATRLGDSNFLSLNANRSTLSLLNLLIVFSSVCIIAMLIAVFALLTCSSNRSTSKKKKKTKKKASRGGQQNEDCANSDSSQTSAGSCSLPITSSSTFFSTASASLNEATSSLPNANNSAKGSGRKSISSTSGSTHTGASHKSHDSQQHELTALDARELAKHMSLSAAQAYQQQQQQQQLRLQQQANRGSCSPSSVETGETMQAVDSIHSAVVSLDNSSLGSLHRQQQSNCQQQQQQQDRAATVVRLIKSCSAANFATGDQMYTQTLRRPSIPASQSTFTSFGATFQEQQPQQVAPAAGYQPVYGSSYGSNTLRTKMRAMQQQRNFAPPQLRQQNHYSLYEQSELPTAQQHSHQLLPATNSYQQQASELNMIGELYSSGTNLCHYHQTLAAVAEVPMQQPQLQPPPPPPLTEDVNDALSLPPPPPLRLIEALESAAASAAKQHQQQQK